MGSPEISKALCDLDRRWGESYDFCYDRRTGEFLGKYWEGGAMVIATDPAELCELVAADYLANRNNQRISPLPELSDTTGQ
jgi:hypothetical protein